MPNPPTEMNPKMVIMLEAFDVHFEFFLNFPRLTSGPLIATSFLGPAVSHSQLYPHKPEIQVAQVLYALNTLFPVLRNVSVYTNKYKGMQGIAPSQLAVYEMEFTTLEKDFREWYESIPSWLRILNRRYGYNYKTMNEDGVLDPLPHESAYMQLLYYVGQHRLYRSKIIQSLKINSPMMVLHSIPFSISKHAAVSFVTIIQVLLNDNPYLDYFPPTISFAMYEVRISLLREYLLIRFNQIGLFVALVKSIQPPDSRTCATNLLNTEIKTLDNLSRRMPVAVRIKGVLQDLQDMQL